MGDGKKKPAEHDDHDHDEVIPTKPFPATIAYSAIMSALPSRDGEVVVLKNAGELIKLLSKDHEVHAGLVPHSVAARSNIKQPRIIISVADPKKPNQQNLRGKLFFGLNFQKNGERLIEFISRNRLTDDWDFGMVEGPQLRTPQQIISCTQCHTYKTTFPLQFPYHDTNFNPALSGEMIAAIFSDDDEVKKTLEKIMGEASRCKDKNPSVRFNELLIEHFGEGSKKPLLYDGVPIASLLGPNADMALFDQDTRVVSDCDTITASLAKMPQPLRAQLMATSLKHAVADEMYRILSREGNPDPKTHALTNGFALRLPTLMNDLKKNEPALVETLPKLGVFSNYSPPKEPPPQGTSRLDVQHIPDFANLFLQQATPQHLSPPFAEAVGLAINLGKPDIPFLLNTAAAPLGKQAAAHLLGNVLKSDRLDKLTASSELPTRDAVMRELAKGMQQEAKKQYGVTLTFNEADYIPQLPALPPLRNIPFDPALPEKLGVLSPPLQQHCVECHDQGKHPIPLNAKGWLELDAANPEQAKALFLKSYQKIEEGEMPKGTDLSQTEIKRLLDWMRDEPTIPAHLRSLPLQVKKATSIPSLPKKADHHHK